MKRVYCLYRVSTLGQVEKDDIPMQKTSCHGFVAAKSDWKIVKEFSEKGISGFKVSAKDRDAIQEIQKEAVEGKFDVLLVFMFDRIGRREDETPFVVEWFVNNGIEVWSVNEGQQRFDTHVDKLMNYIRYWQASGESIKTSVRTKTRMGQIVMEGKFKGGVAAFGYRLEKSGRLNKKNQEVNDLVIDEEEAEVVKLIFDRYANAGLGTQNIATYLTDRGIMNRSGENFVPPTIRNMLKNPTYLGILRSGDSISEPFEHLRIIDDDTFERVQKLAEQRSNEHEATRTFPRTTKSKSCLLSGNIFCGHCGGRLTATPVGKDYQKADGTIVPHKYWRYVCYNRTRHKHRCNGQTGYKSSNIDAIVVDLITGIFSEFKKVSLSEFMDAQFEAKMKECQSNLDRAQRSLKKNTTDLAALKGEIVNAIQGKSKFTSDILNELIEKVAQDHRQAEDDVAQLTAEFNDSEKLIENLKAQHNRFLNWANIFTDSEMEVRKMIIAHLIDRITVTAGNNVEIDFNISMRQFLNCEQTSGIVLSVCYEPSLMVV